MSRSRRTRMAQERSPARARAKRASSRWGLAAAGLIALCAAGLAWRFGPWMSSDPRGPVVVISIDTLRADRLPAYGYKGGRTPAIDALVSDGVLFERAYTHSPLTLPAHVSILSGQLPHHHGVRDNVGFTLRAGQKLLPAWLREHGFATGGVVSSAVLREATGIAAGFDFYDGRMPAARGGAALDEAQRAGDASLEIARQWVKQQSSGEWFLFLHLYEPHAPYSPPPRYQHLEPYDGEIASADEIVGRLVEDLRAAGLYDRATIVLLSDHGEGLGDHGEQEHGLFLYEEAVRVPLVVKLPAQQNGGTRIPELVQHVDLLPTILDLARVPVPPGLHGRSLRQLLDGRRGEWPERSVYSEALFGRYHFGWSELFALTDARFRFIHAPRPELYDIQTDPREQQNLASVRAPAAAAMSQALMQVVGGAEVGAPQPIAPDVRERLASLGYVGPQSRDTPGKAGGSRADPKDKVAVLVRYRRALEFMSAGKMTDAIDSLRSLAREEPGFADVWQTIARLLQRTGRVPEAVEAYREYLRHEPASVSGLLELSSLFLSLERFDDAQAHAELASTIAAKQEPTDALSAYEMLAKIALARNLGDEARRHARQAAGIDPGFPLGDYVEGRLAYAANNFEAASASFARAVRANSERTVQIRGLHLYAGDTLAHLERFPEAERAFQEEIRLFPENTWAYLSLANVYRVFGRVDEAERVLDAMLAAVPSAEARAQADKLRAARASGGGEP